MAAKDLYNTDTKKHEELDDITTCCICTEVYTDPKALPCIHTFCMKCIQETGLKTNKGPGDEMPCPICRGLFRIPLEGFSGLPKNFFIERLIQMSKVSATELCSLCLEESEGQTGAETPIAATYCVDCKYKLCEECCSEHTRFKATKNHKLMPLTEYKSSQNVMTNLVPIVCEVHGQKVLDVYCTDCKTVLCAICFIEEHKTHDGSHVSKCVDGFRKQTESNAETMNLCIAKAHMKKEEIMKVKEEMYQMVENLESDVEKRKEEIKKVADKHASNLRQDICSEWESRLKEIHMATDDTDAYILNLESYNSYCQRILDEGSANDICSALSVLSVRALELQQACQPVIEREIPNFRYSFSQSELEEFLNEDGGNLVGEIQDECNLKTKKRSKQFLLAERSNEIDKLKLELAAEKTTNNLLQVSYDKLVEELELCKATLKTAETNTEQLIKKLGEQRYKSDPVLVRMIRTKYGEEKKKDIRGLAILGKELFVVREKSLEVEVYDSIKFSVSRRWKLKELFDPWDIASCIINKCLYIFDYKGIGDKSKEILRVDPNGNVIKNWSTGDGYGRLSVTYESNVILASFNHNKLNEYLPDGHFIREINLFLAAGIRSLWHAIKLTNGHFLVSHGDDDDDDLHRVCLVDSDGKPQKSFGGRTAIGQMNRPVYLSVDGNGFVMVVDQMNRRVLLLDADLKFKREILSKEKHGLRYPDRILLDESNGRLFVADNALGSSRILVFD